MIQRSTSCPDVGTRRKKGGATNQSEDYLEVSTITFLDAAAAKYLHSSAVKACFVPEVAMKEGIRLRDSGRCSRSFIQLLS